MEFPKRPNFKEIEKKLLERWTKDLFYIYRFDPEKSGKVYIIDIPPPFTSGEPHVGTVFGFVWMDFIARYMRMHGYNVYFPVGWDVHGLPTELKIEKKKGIPKEDVKRFVEECRKFTLWARDRMKEAFLKAGVIQDLEKEYMTMDDLYKKLTQYTLIEMYEKGLLYRGKHPVYWCPNCETAVSAQEVGYKKMKGILAYIKLPTEDGRYVLIATTRPEMLSACVIVLFSDKGEYVETEDGLIVSKKYAEEKGLKIKRVLTKEELEKIKIRIPLINRTVSLKADPDVDPEFGTGIVWVCTYGDEQDIVWQKRYSLPVYEIIDEKGRLINTNIPEIEGLKVQEARKKIVEILREKGYLYDLKEIEHNVLAHTERSACQHPIELRPTYQWFFKVQEFKDMLLKIQKEIKFYPEEMRQRLIDWINSIAWDWVISRQRVWGCPFPFWVCNNGHIIPAPKDKLPVDPRIEKPPYDKCPVCGAELEPVKDVLDCWVESSITPLAILVYAFVKARKSFEEAYRLAKEKVPVNLRPQGYEIIRTWLFNTLYRVYILTGKLPWKEVLINGMIVDEKGRKMSKSLGNVVTPFDVLDKYPADAFRYWALLAAHGYDYRFTWKEIEAGQSFLIKLWNISRYIWMNCKDIDLNIKVELKPIDLWIISELKELIDFVEEQMKEYRFWEALKRIRKFVWEIFADNYLELVKERVKNNDLAAKWTLLYVLRQMLGILAPFLPFITEEIYNIMFAEKEGKKSIHETEYPKVEIYNKEILEKGRKMLEAVTYMRKWKTEKGLKLKEEVEKMEIPFKEEDIKPFEDEIKSYLRIKEIIYKG